MSMVVTHSMAAMNANRQLGVTTSSQSKTSEKLSSGYRINRAADDAAGLTISEKMRSQIRGLTQASTNCQDGISLVQTAEGALGEVHSMLQRMNELAVKAANGTNTSADRTAIQKEISQLTTEIDRVAESTEFNTMMLLRGDDTQSNKKSLNLSNPIDVSELDKIDGVKLVYTEVTDDVETTQTSTGSVGLTDSKYNNLKTTLEKQIVPQAVQSLLNTFSTSFGYLSGSSIGIGLKLENNPSSSILASVGMGASWYSTDPIQAGSLSYTLTVNVASLNIDSSGNMSESDRNNLEVTIVHEMMHAFMDEVTTNGMIGYSGTGTTVSEAQKYPGWFKEGMANVAAGAFYNGNDWVNGSMGISGSSSLSSIKSAIAKAKLSSGSTASKYGTGALATMYLGFLQNKKDSGSGTVSESGLKSGVDKILNRLKTSDKSLNDIVKELTGYSSISAFETGFGTQDSEAQFVKDLAAIVGTTGSGGLATGFSSVNGVLPNSNLNISLFKLDTDHSTVTNVYPDDYPVFAGSSKMSNAGYSGPTTSTDGKITPKDTSGASTGGITVFDADGQNFIIQAGAQNRDEQRITIHIDNMDATSIGISDVDVSTIDGAKNAIDKVNSAISTVSAQRSSLGAYQNRLEHTISNLDNIVENTTAAESDIRDTDMAKTMVDYAKNNILAQAGTSMLAQANQSAQNVLALLS